MQENKITIQASVAADKKKTWDYYTQPNHIINWNFASDDWQCTSASNDMCVGGVYSAQMAAKDETVGFDFVAIYNEIIEGESFTYTMPDKRKVQVNFKQVDDKTEIIIHFEAEYENPIELQRDGWQAILNNFKKYTEEN
jgi:uncharacterized protein YndB with AHSA1/START domain